MKNPASDSFGQRAPTDAFRADLARKIACFIGTAESLTTAIPGLSLHRRTTQTGRCSMTYQPSIIVVPQGKKRAELGPSTFDYGGTRFLLTAIDLPVVSRVVEASEAKPFLAIALRLEIATVRELLSHEEVEAGNTAISSGSQAMATGELTPEFLGACCRLVDLLDAPRDIPFLGPLIQREIVYRILRGPEGSRLRAIATLGDQSQRTAKAIAWIKANYTQPLRVEELADLAGMGVSTLHHHFRALTAMSPLQYQKQLRLQTARSRMLLDGLDAATAAYEAGYESPSQFNREYSRFFGQPPMRDIRTLRSPSAPLLESIAT